MSPDLTDEEVDASIVISGRLADEIETIFAGNVAADCVMALARVFGRAVARQRESPIKEQFRLFAEAALVECRYEIGRRPAPNKEKHGRMSAGE